MIPPARVALARGIPYDYPANQSCGRGRITMETRRLGKTGMMVSVIGFGASEIGYQNVAPRTVETLLNSALDAGLNVIDTAACYDASEELIGRAIGHRRNEYYLLTKCGHAKGLTAREWTPGIVAMSLARSLKRMRTDYVDLLQFHSCDAETLRDDALIAALARTREQGLARAIGYSGDGPAARAAIALGVFDTLQISVNLADQEALERALPEAAARDMGVIAKRPIANAAWLQSRWSIPEYGRPYRRRLRKLDYPALRGDRAATIGAALRFTLAAPGVHTAIIGTTRPSRWEENAALLKAGPMPAGEFAAIRARWREVAGDDWVGLR